MTGKNKKVSVVILNWNRKDKVLDCIHHIKKLNYPVYNIIVVDNASTDGSVEAIKNCYPDVILVVNKQNLGAPAGKNVGLREALKHPVDFVYMVDNDIVVDPDSLTQLIRVFESDSKAGIVGAMMYDYSHPDIILSAGGIIDFTQNVGRGRGDRERDSGQYDKIEEVDYLWGGAMLAKREILEEVGLFDAEFKGYWFEDTDFSVRVRKAGYKVFFCPYAKVWHKPHLVLEQFSYRKKYLATKNAVRFMKKHATFKNWIKYSFFVILGFPYAFIRDLLLHNSAMGAIGKLKGFIDGLFEKNET